jgi:3-isopropylmalate/(R)-2-methylmalate dehydratase small subunit
MEKFTTHTGIAAPLYRANIDTDQIIPKQFLKSIRRVGFGEKLFYDWRFGADGAPKPEFVLNEPRYDSASILLAGKNFGCGSSREHAPWALAEFGFRAIIAPSFADIFSNNSVQSGIACVVLSDDMVADLVRKCEANDGYQLTVDLESCSVFDGDGFRASFEIDDFVRFSLLNALDTIGLSLQREDKIAQYEANFPKRLAQSPSSRA